MMAMALEDLDPALWGTLSDELLHLVFLRLPVAEINQIRLLSMTWKRSIDSVDSHLSRMLEDTVCPNLFGLIDLDNLRARVFDVKRDQWYVRSTDPACDWTPAVDAADGELDRFDSESTESFPSAMCAADGGLICFVSENTDFSLSVVVMNPLTGKKVVLPHLLNIPNVQTEFQPSMVQLTMDRQTNQYKVWVVGYLQSGNRGLFAQVYDSQTEQWSVVGSGERSGGRIFGYEYVWILMTNAFYYSEECLGPCLYDFAEGQLHRFNGNELAHGRSVRSYALLGDRLFVLHRKRRAGPSNLIPGGQEQKRKYYISEYRIPTNGTAWVKVETHGCDPFEDYPKENHHLSLHACNGFLMVIGHSGDYDVFAPPYEYEYRYEWLYNLSTYKWHALPEAAGAGSLDLMWELRWSARP